ncbi:hypothetical protein FZO89_05185 [Luteimonas viscosa]|uniref:Type IV pilus biogenesis protein PilP n=1 Tax=Luteimonas viscosa TaxID=1132694 RepID=A0A5D4XM02_9GAMM|nr:hypothetical protein [Luteimonas viscosa]TYT25697.1 hypothetical protein FZO89_05185 [Luteimonas viscosa]
MRCFSFSLLWLFSLPLAAQPATHPCAAVAVPAERLACYDQAFPPPPEVHEAANERARADFGFDQPRESLRNPGQAVEQADPQGIESTVIRVDHGRNGRSFNLENGQVWTQTDARSGGQVQPGDSVQVRKAILAGYQLVTPNGVVLRVRRTR